MVVQPNFENMFFDENFQPRRYVMNKELKKLYKKYNKELFGGFLTTPKKLKFKKLNKKSPFALVMGVTLYYKNSKKIEAIYIDVNNFEEDVYTTLIHEMVHQAEVEMFGKSPKHGKLFKSMVKKISKKLNIKKEDII